MELFIPSKPPEHLAEQFDPELELAIGLDALECGGAPLSWFDYFKYLVKPKPNFSSLLYDPTKIDLDSLQAFSNVSINSKPSGLALFAKSDIEAADKAIRFADSGMNMHRMMQWLQYTLGSTCGVGIGWVENFEGVDPHIRLYTLPQSGMRGAIGWTWGPPLARNRRMELSQTLVGRAWPSWYLLRTFMHEFGHFLGHYGTSAHSNRREDLMYPSVQNIPPTGPRCGKSANDVEWEIGRFGQAWIELGSNSPTF